ncbi:MAG: heavy metal translocating P-type ATPase [Candidatus Nomurabacteria bacterium]|nr:MAG: heavy metal translocating P-type ATPase [Candidatus Nomurabacteria bacterium]
MFKQKFWVSLLLTLPVLYFSQTIQDLIGFTAPSFTGSQYIPAILGITIFFYGGLVFLKSAKAEIANRQPGMMTLISMAISVAFVYSSLITLSIVDGMSFWWELASLITIMLLGHWLEMASISNAQGALKELAKLLPDEAELITTSGTKTVSISELKVGDKVLVRPGAGIPMDGLVVKGESKVNESMLTGESKPVEKSKNDQVIGGTINGSGSLTIKITKVGDDTALSGIMKMVADAQATKSKTQLLADKAASYLFYYALLAAFITGFAWTVFGDVSANYTLERIVAVLIIACPHALGLAIPLVTAISTSKGANAGLLVRQRMALESARNIDVVLFDKTGTLTKGEQGVTQVIGADSKRILELASGVEQESEHPIARAIVAAANERKLKPAKVTGFSALEGRGAKAKIGNKVLYLGGPQLLKELGVTLSASFAKATSEANENGQSIIYLVENNQTLGALLISDVIREESRKAVEELQKSGKRVAMITGDSEGVAKWVSSELGLDEYYAEVLPGNKADIVKKLQSDGSIVAMVGDGVNDAPALTQADIGIAIGAGTDVAIESAGIVLASSDPRGVAKIVKLSKKTYTKMVQNLIWATGYNLLAVPAAAGAFASVGFVLSPAIGAALMSLSTIIVAANAQLLRRVEL